LEPCFYVLQYLLSEACHHRWRVQGVLRR